MMIIINHFLNINSERDDDDVNLNHFNINFIIL